jgi:hypothetical protein
MRVRGCPITYSDVPWIHLKRFMHVLADAHELAEHKRALFRLLLSDDELHRGRVHPISKGRDDPEVGNRKQSVKFIL